MQARGKITSQVAANEAAIKAARLAAKESKATAAAAEDRLTAAAERAAAAEQQVSDLQVGVAADLPRNHHQSFCIGNCYVPGCCRIGKLLLPEGSEYIRHHQSPPSCLEVLAVSLYWHWQLRGMTVQAQHAKLEERQSALMDQLGKAEQECSRLQESHSRQQQENSRLSRQAAAESDKLASANRAIQSQAEQLEVSPTRAPYASGISCFAVDLVGQLHAMQSLLPLAAVLPLHSSMVMAASSAAAPLPEIGKIVNNACRLRLQQQRQHSSMLSRRTKRLWPLRVRLVRSEQPGMQQRSMLHCCR